MATKEDIISGLELLIREGNRIANDLTPDQWNTVVDMDGWKGVEVLSHVAGIGSLVAPMVGGMAGAPAGSDSFAAFDIDQINAGIRPEYARQRFGIAAIETFAVEMQSVMNRLGGVEER